MNAAPNINQRIQDQGCLFVILQHRVVQMEEMEIGNPLHATHIKHIIHVLYIHIHV